MTISDETNNEKLKRIADSKKKILPCKWCGQLIKMKQGQQFCTSKCRTLSHQLERATEKERWEQERVAFVKEITALTKELEKVRSELESRGWPSK